MVETGPLPAPLRTLDVASLWPFGAATVRRCRLHIAATVMASEASGFPDGFVLSSKCSMYILTMISDSGDHTTS